MYESAYLLKPPDTMPEVIPSFSGLFESVVDHYVEQELSVVCRQAKVQRLHEKRINPFEAHVGVNPDEILADLHHRLFATRENGGLGYTYTGTQKKWLTLMLQAVAPGIYRDTFEINAPLLERRYGWDLTTNKPFLNIIAPRREGKTFAVAAFMACYVYCVPYRDVNGFSPSGRPSEKLLQLTLKMLHRLPDVERMFLVRNKETVWIQGRTGDPEDVRKLYCYPSNSKMRTHAALVVLAG